MDSSGQPAIYLAVSRLLFIAASVDGLACPRQTVSATMSNETTTNASTVDLDYLDSLWPDQTPFDVAWYGGLLIVLYSLVFSACVVGKFLSMSLPPVHPVSLSRCCQNLSLFVLKRNQSCHPRLLPSSSSLNIYFHFMK